MERYSYARTNIMAVANLDYYHRFELVVPLENDNYSPMDDIIQTIEHVCRYYLPKNLSVAMLDDSTGYSRRLKRAIRDQSFDTFASIVKEYNKALKVALDNETVANRLKETPVLDLPLIDRITSQIYSRTVSPKVEILKKYENGTSNVYGEVLASFASNIFTETNLQSDGVFVDMGSGVGNVVLQAALEIGCESWGIEQMHNPASLAAEQITEFNARCRRWSIKPGKATLIEGDFLNSPEIDAALKRADVVLINNKAFLPELNSAILMKMLDLREGCRVVSLKSFVPIDWKIKTRNVHDPRNLLRVERKEYFSGGVSWTHDGGEYFVATKDSSMLQDFLKKSPMI
jgi:H3 lysine-79-specific histone-lysine N-methyltransferase